MTSMADRIITTPARPPNLPQAALEAALAAAVLIAADVVVRVVPFDRIAQRIERKLRRTATPARNELGIGRVMWAVAAAHRRLAWIPCLATAIAANRLLAWRGVASELWLGVRPDAQATIAAHAWLEADGSVVTGAAEKKAFQPLHKLVTARP
jgi:hypothetical protein